MRLIFHGRDILYTFYLYFSCFGEVRRRHTLAHYSHVCFAALRRCSTHFLGLLACAEVFHLYKGQADNGTLLLNYGFAVPENPYDAVTELLVPSPLGLVRVPLAEALTMRSEPTELLRVVALARAWDYQDRLKAGGDIRKTWENMEKTGQKEQTKLG